ncbi:MAG: radical SAM protein [Acidobacteriota bacterium]
MRTVALVGPEIEENLSLRYLASSLAAAGYAAEIVPFAGESEFGHALARIRALPEPPLLVGISLAFQWRAMDMMAMAMALRDDGYEGHVTVGGHFATFASQDLLRDFPEIDSVVRQEAEETLVALARAVETGAPLDPIPGLAIRRADGTVHLTAMPSIPDLATLPRPDRRGNAASCFGHGIAPLVSSRGCYANCTFCCIAAWHEETQPGKRYRLRPLDDVADEMVALKRERGVDIFVFHDDNFFVPRHDQNVQRIAALADAVEARGIGEYATVVKARPTDVTPEVFDVLVNRLQCIRCYIGVETDSEQGLKTLRRWAHPWQNHRAIEIVRNLGLYVCFNMLVFDPDTTIETFAINVDFMDEACDYPFNFGRVELYAGTPLLHRMQEEKRVRGDYMQWDYALADAAIERVWKLTIAAFHDRNFGPGALNNLIMGTRFDIEVARKFHPDVFRPEWRARGIALSRELGHGSARGLREILAHVARTAPGPADQDLVADLSARLRPTRYRSACARRSSPARSPSCSSAGDP